MDGINAFWNELLYALSNMRFFDVIDILAITFIVYQAIKFFRESRAGQLVKGIVVLLAVFILADWFDLVTLKWLLTRVADSLIVIAAIIFQPELRRLLEKVGHSNLSQIGKNQLLDSDRERTLSAVNNICKAVSNMQEKRIGALIVFEGKTNLSEIADTGTQVDAAVSTELVQNIFFPKSPLHDGAAVIRDNRIISAGCILPLTSNTDLNSQLGTRHRAAIGMSENSDAMVVVVSEETGIISAARNGRIKRDYNAISLREELSEFLLSDQETEKPFYLKWYDKITGKNKTAEVTGETKDEENN